MRHASSLTYVLAYLQTFQQSKYSRGCLSCGMQGHACTQSNVGCCTGRVLLVLTFQLCYLISLHLHKLRQLCAPCVGYAGHYTFPFTACDRREDSVSRLCAALLGSAAEQISLLTGSGQVRPSTPAPVLFVLQRLGTMFAVIKVRPACLLALLLCLSACLPQDKCR